VFGSQIRSDAGFTPLTQVSAEVHPDRVDQRRPCELQSAAIIFGTLREAKQ
jgi:hypothetical protein